MNANNLVRRNEDCHHFDPAAKTIMLDVKVQSAVKPRKAVKEPVIQKPTLGLRRVIVPGDRL